MFGPVISCGRFGLCVASAALIVSACPVWAQEAPVPDELVLIRTEIDALRQEEQARALRLMVLEDRLRALETAAGLTGSAVVPDDQQGAIWKRFGITEQSTYVFLDQTGRVLDQGYLDDRQLTAKVKTMVA